ncbi:phage holin family protein [Burkholderia arboris]|uniref:holin n=1 Tax=Burkholderia cepacia complex TaxID=87882 RepID=UPI00064A2233|nr:MULTISPECIES: holin [Burkholderia cepacia complex]AKM43958.1 holin [Burkholderia contaminans]MCA8035380.1 phage holin family protein [Burkholderia arboris]
MQLNAHEKELLTLVVLGAVIGLGKLLVGGERLTVRILLGRMIVGAGLSSSAGAILIMFKELEPTALIGVASAIGILGQSVLEAAAQRLLGRARGQSENRDGQ